MTKKKINPFKVVRKTLDIIGYTIIGLMFAGSVIIASWAAIDHVWQYWGAWAITVPFLFLIGLVIAAVLIAAIGFQIERFGAWYRGKEWDWNNKHTKNN